MQKILFFTVLAIVGVCLTVFICNQYPASVITCKVLKLQQQQKISGSSESVSTDIRYLIVTDQGTFVCKNALLHFKFNNSDIFLRLKEDSTYKMKVAGVGKSIFTEYKNVLKVY